MADPFNAAPKEKIPLRKAQAEFTVPPPVIRSELPRHEEVANARRRRRDSSYFDGNDFKLLVPEEEKDSRFVYRWVNDDKYRLNLMTKHDDWDICTVEEFSQDFKNTNEGTQISRIVGKDATGQPMRAFLCRKLKAYDEEDRAKELKRLDQLYNQMREGVLPVTGGLSQENEHLRYVPREARRS
jgi:hypothetical protein